MAVNPFASRALNGTQSAAEDFFVYTYDVILTANQALTDQVNIDGDADFGLRGVAVNVKTGVFKVRFNRSGIYFFSSSFIHSNNLESDAASPLPIIPEMVFAASSRIGIDITDLSGAGNTIQIAFIGAKRK